MKEFLTSSYQLLKKTMTVFQHVKAFRLAASLSFYVILSLAPLLVIIVGLAGLVLGAEAARGELNNQVTQLIGSDGAIVVETLLSSQQAKEQGVLSTVIGILTLLAGATGVFVQMQDALNSVWELPERQSTGWGIRNLIRDRLLSFSVVAGLSFLLLVSLLANAMLTGLQSLFRGKEREAVAGIQILELLMSVVLSFILFALIFKILPDRRVRWKNVTIGAVFTGLLFNGGKYLIGLYLGTAAIGSPFGAAGSLVVMLVWIYYSAVILFFGASFTRVYSEWNDMRKQLQTESKKTVYCKEPQHV